MGNSELSFLIKRKSHKGTSFPLKPMRPFMQLSGHLSQLMVLCVYWSTESVKKCFQLGMKLNANIFWIRKDGQKKKNRLCFCLANFKLLLGNTMNLIHTLASACKLCSYTGGHGHWQTVSPQIQSKTCSWQLKWLWKANTLDKKTWRINDQCALWHCNCYYFDYISYEKLKPTITL